MRMNRNTWFLLVLLASLPRGCYKEILIQEPPAKEDNPFLIKLNGVPAFEDLRDKMVLYTLATDSLADFSPMVDYSDHSMISFNGIELLPGEVNELGAVRINQGYELLVANGNDTDTFTMMFTTIPLLRIITDQAIPYEPKIESWLQLQYSDQSTDRSTIMFESDAGIEIRGISANLYDKRAYGIELWNNKLRDDRSVPLLGMGYGEDWILDAMYIDKSRMRNKVSFEVWNSMDTSTPDKPSGGSRTGIMMEYVELFLNNRYQGLYCLGEKMDEHLINFNSGKAQEGGVMYKTYENTDGSATFRTYASEPGPGIEWDGWEQIFPDDFVNWDPLVDLRKLVTLEEDEKFAATIGNVLDLANVANFYLFLNLIMGWDNTGKNVFLARYDKHSKFFFLPWDLEATWGRSWKMEDQNPYGLVGNGLHERLIGLNAGAFIDSLSSKWDHYRSGIFQKEALTERFGTQYELLKKNGVIQRENLRWDLHIDLDEEYLYLADWIEKRLEVLDSNF